MDVRSIKMMIANSLRGVRQALRGIVNRTNATKRVILVQAAGVNGETFNGAEYFQHPGFRSVPLAGSQPVIIPLNGNSANGVIIACSNGKLFITDLNEGEVAVFNETDGLANSMILRNGRIANITCDVLNIHATTAVNIQTQQMTVDASSGVDINTPTVTMSDDLAVGGNAQVAAQTQTATLSVTSTAAGASQMAGGLNATGEIKSQGKSLPHHTHPGVLTGLGHTGEAE